MYKDEKWNEFLNNLLSCALKNLQATKEYEYRRKRQEHIDEMLTTNLTRDQKDMIDEVLFEFGLVQERETELLYRQGLKDCVWVLNKLGLLT
ncbi:hypothetical protein [Akkermansia muciniphila]|uniref:hypothetical protein n=1 Tax=Akkermansia muciniphila TaxID=239935 RepID=UPI00122F66E1|nr:hypothetical protein F1912_11600 [Akkermansia muciniphila]